METKYCKNKKCGRLLPVGYKSSKCESCRTDLANQMNSGGKVTVTLVLAALGCWLKYNKDDK